jgi:hypothetical protein
VKEIPWVGCALINWPPHPWLKENYSL